MTKFYIRPFEPKDTEKIIDIARRMLRTDPLVDYICSNVSHDSSLGTYITLLIHWATTSKRGAIDLVCTKKEKLEKDDSDDGEVVAGAAIWTCHQPHQRFSWNAASLGWSSLEGVYHLYRLGLRGSKRLLFDYPSYRSECMSRIHQVDPSIRSVLDDCWSLNLLVLDHGFQRRGLESMLLQAQRLRATTPILLEVATVIEMNYFREMGFELLDRFKLGKEDDLGTAGHDREDIDVFLLVQR